MRFLSGILNILDQKERVRLFLLIFLDIVISALDIAFLGLTILVINFYIKNSDLPYLSWLPHWLTNKDSILLISVFFVLFGIKNWIAYLIAASRFRFIYSVASRLSERNIRQYLKEDYIRFVNIDSSVYIRKISHQPIEFSNYILAGFQQIISQCVLVLFSICAIVLYHASLFFLLFILLMPTVILLGWLLKRKLKYVRRHIKKTNSDTLKNLKEALAGYIESNIYGKDDFFAGRYYRQQQQLNGYICTQQILQSLPGRLIEVFAILGFFILIVINKWSARTPAVDLLTIGIFIAAAYKIIPGMVKILNSAGQMKTYEFTLDDLLSDDNKTSPTIKPIETIHSIGFEKINFKYNGHPVLNGLSFEIAPGDFVGISANSGRGKTTLMHILLGFIEQEDGLVSINHRIRTSRERQDYRSRISYIKQQPFFINDTVRNNITLHEGRHDEIKLKEVIDFCGLDTLLGQYGQGGNLVIAENGKNLSGGQRQRIMLARAMYHDFDLLILDEPFGEMDQLSENAILSRLQSLAEQDKMIIFITHNKAGLSFCNKVISLDD
ncbi:MAG: transporter ATP-binding protein [Mucilaginibacter sp.]|nr:transporter ATP-binding protein [Mucilaginibacter sp.]